jgi:cell division protein ZapA
MSSALPVSVRVRILDREYPLRVAPGDEDYTVHLAARVDERLRRLRQQLPSQPDMTHAVLVALELAEELYAARAETDRLRARLEIEAASLSERIEAVLGSGDGAAGTEPETPDE